MISQSTLASPTGSMALRTIWTRLSELLNVPSFSAKDEAGRTTCAISVVGVGMRSHVGIASKMFRTLAEEGINIQMISTSEIKISVVIDEKYLELAVRVLHKAFDLDQEDA